MDWPNTLTNQDFNGQGNELTGRYKSENGEPFFLSQKITQE